ncbi:MAG: hydantoinase/oxoprolinase family protein [Hyphomonadaceae bacterium]|nr:hydantoinase/oxoprolinase family protein [Hyphomonadaceae bacterium]
MRIGIDVGGTHTDAVIMDGNQVITSTKVLTSADVMEGVANALDTILSDSGLPVSAIESVMIGTTQFTNAIIERRQLAPTGVFRLNLPSGRGLPPMVDWPDDIAEAVGRHTYTLHGGKLYDGWPIAELDPDEIDRAILDAKAKGLKNFAISSAFSPMDPSPEAYVEARLRAAIPEAKITCSHSFGRLGLMERENAAILNATLLHFAETVVSAFLTALRTRNLRCPVFISQNDGTLMSADFVSAFPALTFASGPTNSLRGAMLLTGLEEAIVVDIGGTTSDIGVLQGGFPRESNAVIEVGGVRTNFRMPDIQAIGLGGGSLVSADGETIGPQSVGHRLTQDGLIFGGNTLTATDIVVASGHQKIGNAAAVAGLPEHVVETARKNMLTILDRGIDMMKPGAVQMPVILVGGGSVLVTGDLTAAKQVHRPEHAGVANAIGAAIAQVGGESEKIVSYQTLPRDAAIAELTQEARDRALGAGAAAESLRTVDIEETEVPYMGQDTMRLRIKVIGDLAVTSAETSA